MIKAKRAAEIVRTLSKIEAEFARYYDGKEPDLVFMDTLHGLIGELRDMVWHEVPDVLSRLMDQEEGVFRELEKS